MIPVKVKKNVKIDFLRCGSQKTFAFPKALCYNICRNIYDFIQSFRH